MTMLENEEWGANVKTNIEKKTFLKKYIQLFPVGFSSQKLCRWAEMRCEWESSSSVKYLFCS